VVIVNGARRVGRLRAGVQQFAAELDLGVRQAAAVVQRCVHSAPPIGRIAGLGRRLLI
jgi:hypothetical protein